MRRLLGSALGLLLSLSGGPPAAADGPDEPNTELRIMRWGPRDSAGTCFGEPRTPLCAVETYEACLIWNRPSLCGAVGRTGPQEGQPRPERPGEVAFFPYRIFGQRILYPEDIPAARATGPNAWRPGDIALLAEWQACGPREQCLRQLPDKARAEDCPPVQCRIMKPATAVKGEKTFVVRRAGDRWNIVEATYEQVLPNAIWGR